MTDEAPKPSRQVCVVMRMLKFHNGETLLVPYGLYDDAAAGAKAGEQAQGSLAEMLRTCVVGKRVQSVDGQQGVESLMPLQSFLAALGIASIQHVHAMNDVQGMIVQPPPRLIVPTKH